MELFKRLKQSLFGSSRSSKAKKKTKAVKKKTANRPKKTKKAKKKVKKTAKKAAKKVPKKSKAKKSKPKKAAAKKKAFEGKLVGRVTHYFSHVHAAVLNVEKGPIRVGDKLYFKGHTTDFKETVKSMEIDRNPIQQAATGDEIGLQVKKRVREHDLVYKL